MNELITYIRNKQNNPVGVVIAKLREDKTIGIGFSYCRKGDKYDKPLGFAIARGRADIGFNIRRTTHSAIPKICTVPRIAQPIIKNMKERALSYFKGNSVARDVENNISNI